MFSEKNDVKNNFYISCPTGWSGKRGIKMVRQHYVSRWKLGIGGREKEIRRIIEGRILNLGRCR